MSCLRYISNSFYIVDTMLLSVLVLRINVSTSERRKERNSNILLISLDKNFKTNTEESANPSDTNISVDQGVGRW